MFIARDVEHIGLRIAERQQVHRGEIARRIVEEHIFGAGVRRIDRTRRRAGVPVVDRRVILQARIGGGPGGIADLFPKLLGLQGLCDLAVDALDEVPVLIGLDRAQEVVGDAHRIVRILASDRQIGFRIPVGVIGVELDLGIALARELDDALHIAIRHAIPAGHFDGLFQRRVLFRIVAIVVRALAIHGGLEDGLHMLLDDFRPGDERGDLLLLLHLPVDIGFDVGMVGVDDDHLGRAARRAARFDGACRAVADLEKRHQARRLAAARELFVLAAQLGEIRAGARAIFEQAGLTHPQVHDAALIDEVVGDRLDETGMRLRMFVGRLRLGQFFRLEVDIIMALAGAIDAIGPVQAGVEPLRGIGRGDLARQHGAMLFIEGERIVFRVEIFALPAPIGPRAGKPVEHVRGRTFRSVALVLGESGQRRLVRDRPPQEGGDVVFLDLLQACGNAGLAKIFLRDDVRRDLAPCRGHVDVILQENHRAVRVADLALALAKVDVCIGALACRRVLSLDAHLIFPESQGAGHACAEPLPRPVCGWICQRKTTRPSNKAGILGGNIPKGISFHLTLLAPRPACCGMMRVDRNHAS